MNDYMKEIKAEKKNYDSCWLHVSDLTVFIKIIC